MRLTAAETARTIDISAVRAQHGEAEIRALVRVAKERRFLAVHVLPCWVPFAKSLLFDSPDILIGSPVGFPSGAHRTEVKLAEARLLIADGVQEMDMMINVGKLRSGGHRYVEDEIRAVVQAAGGIPVKVILEVCYLTREDIKTACEICIRAGAAFIKTSSGWAGGATMDVVSWICSLAGSAIQVKASGGIRDLDTLVKMRRLGVTRFGINVEAAWNILDEVVARPGGSVEI